MRKTFLGWQSAQLEKKSHIVWFKTSFNRIFTLQKKSFDAIFANQNRTQLVKTRCKPVMTISFVAGIGQNKRLVGGHKLPHRPISVKYYTVCPAFPERITFESSQTDTDWVIHVINPARARLVPTVHHNHTKWGSRREINDRKRRFEMLLAMDQLLQGLRLLATHAHTYSVIDSTNLA